MTLDAITVVPSKSEEKVSDALAPVTVLDQATIQTLQATRTGDLYRNVPGVWIQDRGDDPSSSINIRGLQDFGRVAVVVDGARQNYQRTGHNANGSFFLNPELIGGIDIVRGPTANIYGSGAIGGVASFRTKDIQDVVRPGERWGIDTNTFYGTNQNQALGSAFGGVHVNPNVDVFAGGTYSTQDSYKDGTGTLVDNTAQHLSSGIAKITVRPADGHEVKLGGIFQEDLYDTGQPRRPVGLPFALPGAAGNGTSVYATDVKNYTTTLGWKYSRPDDNVFDWDSKIYWNRTDNQQTKILHNSTAPGSGTCAGIGPGNSITGCVGDQRGYLIDTFGIDLHNTSRFNSESWRHAVTYGADGFRDEVSGFDRSGNSTATTPSGERSVTGAFVQWKANYTSLLEMVGAVRYDNYKLDTPTGSASGDRFSPKITIGLLPASVVTPYVSYAEGYRAPSITETLVGGAHVATGPGQGDFSICADGTRGFFCFLPNPNLRPEVGKNKEIGLNIKKDGIFRANDSFRGKVNVFRNDVDDYIDSVTFTGAPFNTFPPFGTFPTTYVQYQNIAHARIQGFEAETMYDANDYFFGVAVTLQEGKNTQTDIGLYSIQPQKVTTTAGLRFMDNKLVLSATWTAVKANTDIPATYLPGSSYDLVNVYMTIKPTKDIAFNFSVENIFDQYYRPYAIPLAADTTSTQNDVLWASAGPGITFKGALKIHFGGA